MKDTRYLIADLFVSLPLAGVLAGGIFIYCNTLPRLEADENQRIMLAYREMARAIKEGDAAQVREIDCKNLVRKGQMGRGGSWGFEPQDEQCLVWYQPSSKASRVWCMHVPTLRPMPLRRWFWTIGGLISLSMLMFLNLGLRRFRRFTAERDDFLAAAAHDLRTPIAALQLLLNDNSRATAIVLRMKFIVDNLMAFLRSGAQLAKPNCISVDLLSLYFQAYALFENAFASEISGPVTIDVSALSDATLAASVDTTWVTQIFWNLLSNDLKYAAPHGPVCVRFRREDGMCVIEFQDAGPGMTAHQRRHAFSRYYRARSAHASGKGGFGVGLCTARLFARALHGDLVVLPRTPLGSTFRLTLPPTCIRTKNMR